MIKSLLYIGMSPYSYAIGPVIGTTLSSIIVYYLSSLERLGCQCSLTTKREYILGFNSFLIAFNLFTLGMGGIHNVVSFFNKYPLLYAVYAGIMVGAIVNVAFTIEFVNEMKRENCACADSVFKDIMYILSIIQAVTWLILLLVSIVIGGLLAKDLATGKITMKNIEKFQKLSKKGAMKS